MISDRVPLDFFEGCSVPNPSDPYPSPSFPSGLSSMTSSTSLPSTNDYDTLPNFKRSSPSPLLFAASSQIVRPSPFGNTRLAAEIPDPSLSGSTANRYFLLPLKIPLATVSSSSPSSNLRSMQKPRGFFDPPLSTVELEPMVESEWKPKGKHNCPFIHCSSNYMYASLFFLINPPNKILFFLRSLGDQATFATTSSRTTPSTPNWRT